MFEFDHCTLLLDTNPNLSHVPKPLKFQAMWTKHKSYQETIQQSWVPERTHPHPQSVREPQNHKAQLAWNTLTFGNLNMSIQSLKAQLAHFQSIIPSPRDLHWIKALQCQLHLLFECEELLWQQKSRDKWIKEGDRNTTHFHASTICRRRRNHIESICNDLNNWYYNQTQISNLLVSHFKNILAPQAQTQPPTYIFPPDTKVICSDTNHKICKKTLGIENQGHHLQYPWIESIGTGWIP